MKNKKIIIVGGNAGALIAAEIFSEQYKEVLFIETYSKEIPKKKVLAQEIKHGLKILADKRVDYFIATGDNDQRKNNYEFIFKNIQKQPVNCIHKTAFISKSSIIGFGNLIGPLALIHTGARIGNNTIINSGAIVEHGCVIDNYAQVSPNVTLCGYVQVGESAFIGAGSSIIPKIKIGARSIVAAGSSVIKDVDSSSMFAGVPAVLKKKI